MIQPVSIARSGTIASGQVGWPHLASGAVRSGHIGNQAVNSGNVSSGQITNDHLASGTVGRGKGQAVLGNHLSGFGVRGDIYVLNPDSPGVLVYDSTNGEVLWQAYVASGLLYSDSLQITSVPYITSGLLGSGQVGWPHLSSGAVRSGHVADNAINSGNVSSGSLDWVHLRSGLVSGLVLQGQIGSGQVDINKLSSGLVSGIILSGQIGSGQVGLPHIASGQVYGYYGNNFAGGRGHIASGSLANTDFASGGIISGSLANGSVISGSIASGQIGPNHLASGAVPTNIYGISLCSFSGGTYQLQSGGASGVWASSDGTVSLPSIQLPSIGLYRVEGWAQTRLAAIAVTNFTGVNVRLFNTTTNVKVSGSERTGFYMTDTVNVEGVTCWTNGFIFANSGDTIQLQASRFNSGSIMTLNANAVGAEAIGVSYIKIGP